ncbi:MAG: cysteine desulfurase [Cycloclasticus sp.]|jgi:cysteine desulfurase/selenocysteine lyase|nr:cysteine desulfurase [Cycloclasticus sp.]MEE4290245.1 cysteine desulfurase [Cycloclasticus sp.]
MNQQVDNIAAYDVERIRQDFPVLDQQVRGKPLVYLDNAATSQKPKAVIDSIVQYYQNDNANIHRGVHTLSERATLSYENARKKVQTFLNASSEKEIVFARGATEAINLVANAFAEKISVGDEILITAMEHHSNIVPWQMLCEKTGAKLKVAPINEQGELVFEEFEALISNKTKFAAISHMSNALGTINPIQQMIELLHQHNIPVLVDGAQAIPHIAVDVQALDCEFYVFSGHKLYAPTGIGALYGKMEQLEQMAPYQGGGDMISVVTFDKTVYSKVPYKFEAGTPNIAGTIGLGAAIDYVNKIGIGAIAAHENSLLEYATEQAKRIKKLRIIGTAKNKGAILSFVLEGIHPHDIGTMMDHQGIAVRAGHHCAMPVMDFFGVPATARASFAMYNTHQEVDALMAGIENLIEMFG